jgi:HlyD family secretion protein
MARSIPGTVPQGVASMSKKPLVLIPLLLAAGGGYWWWRAQEAPGSASALTLYGNVDIRETHLAFGTSERVLELLVQEGDRIQAGQVLGRLRQEKLRSAVAAAQAAVGSAEQVLARLKAGSRPEEIRRARAQAEALKALNRDAELNYQRQQKMAERKLTSPEDLDRARASAESAAAEARASDEALALLLAGSRKEDIAQAEAELAGRRASLALAEEQLKDATLIAPESGILRERILEPGDWATPQTPAFTLALTDPLWVRAYVPEPSLGLVVPGTRAEIRTDSYPDRVYRGWVGSISPTAEFTPKNVETQDLRTRLVYQVRVFVCDPGDELRLGMPATVTIPFGAGGRPARPFAGAGGESGKANADPCAD